ncbi:MAG: phospholipase [Clostridia bacterium]|nr:phospholipase [Clostridia bacterium]
MKKTKKKIKALIIAVLLIFPLIVSAMTKMPEGTSYKGEYYPTTDFEFIYDLSYEKGGETIREHNILEENLRLINEADEFIIADLFLFNDEYNKDSGLYPKSVERVTDALIAKKAENPDMPVVLITDPINNFYGAYEQKYITKLKDGGVDVVITELNALKDSNILVSGYYRCYTKWFGTDGLYWLPNFFEKDAHKVNLRSVIKLANFKANHRKVVITDKEAMVSSANPHDPSSYHSNIALRLKGDVIGDLLETEKTVIALSGGIVPDVTYSYGGETVGEIPKIRIVTENEIKNSLIESMDASGYGDEIRLGIFYISDFDILDALGRAADRGADVKIVADPNKDAFGIEKNGSPNRSALCELYEEHENVDVRWYATKGEQYHGKTAVFNYKRNGETRVILGSANFTRRNIGGFNLETDAEIIMDSTDKRAEGINAYFDRIWENEDGEYTLPIEEYYEDGFLMRILWKIQEVTGLCSW